MTNSHTELEPFCTDALVPRLPLMPYSGDRAESTTARLLLCDARNEEGTIFRNTGRNIGRETETLARLHSAAAKDP